MRFAFFVGVAALAAWPLAAQQRPGAPAGNVGAGGSDTANARRASSGRLTIVAAPAPVSPRIDGNLDDEVWRLASPATGFVQSEPREGRPATEATEVRVAYDAQYLYVAAHMHHHDPSAAIVNDIRKDFREDNQDDFEILLDTFGDRRNGYVFITNAQGAKADRQISNEGREMNTSWDAVWEVRTQRVADGWTAEVAIPFHALRFDPHGSRPWGINFSRRIRGKNEIDFWSPVPRSYNLMRVSLAGDLVGLTTASAGRDLRVKPYVAARTVRATATDAFNQKVDGGVDLKYGVTAGLTLDVTVNPDFAQVEADEQQVNLTQFDQFFPEKREFFLENSGIFYVGDAARNNRVYVPPTPDEDLLLFFSRRIGLTSTGQPIQLPAGLRLTGKLAGFNLGALSMQTSRTGTTPASNYSVLRVRRNVFQGSDIGVMFMNRQSTDTSTSYNRVFGGDANVRFFRRLDWNSFVIGTRTPGVESGQYAARTSLNYEGNFFHGKAGVLEIGNGFNDELGYYRRTDVRKWILDTGLRPRLDALRAVGIREMHPHVTWSYYESPQGEMLAKTLHTGYSFFLNNGGFGELSANPRFERITKPFVIDPSIAPIPVGSYGWNEWQIRGQTDPSRALTLEFTGIAGGLWSGTQRTVRLTTTAHPSYRWRVAAAIQRTAAELDAPANAQFVATVWTMRANYSFTTTTFLDALSQYDPESKQLNANVRFNLIHHPLSDLYIVLNEQRFLTTDGVTPGRSVIIKFTQMLAL
jgi:hypothetical protein